MIRMRIVPMRSEEHSRRPAPQDPDQRASRLFIDSDMTVRCSRLRRAFNPITHARRPVDSFARIFRRAAGAQFAARHIENAGAIAERFQLQQRPGHRQLSIVRMREDGEDIELSFLRT